MKQFSSINPATGSILNIYQVSTSHEIEIILKKSKDAFHRWSLMELSKRKQFIELFKKQLIKSKLALATLISKETGKPLWESSNEVDSAIAKIDLTIRAFNDRVVSSTCYQNGKTLCLRYKPIGTLLVLGPFNFPLHLSHGHILPALLSGNVVIFKSSEFTQGVADFYEKLWKSIGLPKGVFQLVRGGVDVGDYCVKHAGINGVLFTGGYQAGQKISAHLGKTPEKLCVLEMGGNNPLVLADYDLNESCCDLIIRSSFLTAGQRCTSARRLIIVNQLGVDMFLNLLVKKIKEMTIGSYIDNPEPFMGPLISKNAVDQVLDRQSTILDSGGKVLVESNKFNSKGFFVSPGLLDCTGIDLSDVECFGPLLCVFLVDTLDQAIEYANDTNYGLSASILTKKEAQFKYFFNRVQAGIINWNMPTNGASGQLPFGGVGKSGNFRPSGYFAVDYCSIPIASNWNF